MTTTNNQKIVSFMFVLFAFTFIYPSLVAALNKAKPVHAVCECQFPAEVGAYQYINTVKIRHTLLRLIPGKPMMVREIFAERKNSMYRIIALVASTKAKTVGKLGPIIEVSKWNGPYWPAETIYQLTADQVYYSNVKLNED